MLKFPLGPDSTPGIIDISAAKGGIGKSKTADRVRDHLLGGRTHVVMIRIESRRVLHQPAPGEILIASEDFNEAAERVGGVAGVLDPFWAALERIREQKGVIVIDWAAGLVSQRLEAYAAGHIGEILAEDKLFGLSMVVTTRDADVQRQAAANIKNTRQIVPTFGIVLVQNGLHGAFTFADRQAPEAVTYRDVLMPAAKGLPIVNLPRVRGEGWVPFANAGLAMTDVLQATTKDLASLIGRPRYVAAACQSYLQEWFDATHGELQKVLRFPDRAAGQ